MVDTCKRDTLLALRTIETIPEDPCVRVSVSDEPQLQRGYLDHSTQECGSVTVLHQKAMYFDSQISLGPIGEPAKVFYM